MNIITHQGFQITDPQKKKILASFRSFIMGVYFDQLNNMTLFI